MGNKCSAETACYYDSKGDRFCSKCVQGQGVSGTATISVTEADGINNSWAVEWSLQHSPCSTNAYVENPYGRVMPGQTQTVTWGWAENYQYYDTCPILVVQSVSLNGAPSGKHEQSRVELYPQDGLVITMDANTGCINSPNVLPAGSIRYINVPNGPLLNCTKDPGSITLSSMSACKTCQPTTSSEGIVGEEDTTGSQTSGNDVGITVAIVIACVVVILLLLILLPYLSKKLSSSPS